jgi:predicted AlkP superfamily phosphohydrolase/phosphomutase
MIIIGLDGVTWKVIKPHINLLPNFKKLLEVGKSKTITLHGAPWSVPIWTSMFSGKSAKEHQHQHFVENNKIKTRKDIQTNFIWDICDKDIRVLNLPILIPPFNYKCTFDAIGYGLANNEDEWERELKLVTLKAKEILNEKPDLSIIVYAFIDRMQHYLWGTPKLVKWYKKIDEVVGELIKYDDQIIIISDHGFCAFGDSKYRTVKPSKNIRGEHDSDAILITKNISEDINKPEDIFYTIKKVLKC